MSGGSNQSNFASNASDGTGRQNTNPPVSPSAMSSTRLSSPLPSIGIHAVTEGLGNGDGEAQNTAPTDSETDNINGQAGHSNKSAQNTSRGVVLQRRGVSITLVIPTLPETAATGRQELGLDGLATDNGTHQNAPKRTL
ncbi:hypothetical protein GQ44DRAFT_767141 [Phaeosphaeriaceae sp. PMI808]|nr:hypothetical protein GQ44DRAFT_767141 [Phaeosphaeriaceae sp. PMI808]